MRLVTGDALVDRPALDLDHVRALAAFMVFTWQFSHLLRGYPVPFAGTPALFPLALLDEGHTGVALFMTLSGYLFARLLAGQSVSFPVFFWNRLVRLAPLMIVVALTADLATRLATRETVAASFATVFRGFLLPSAALDHGFWPIVVEVHFHDSAISLAGASGGGTFGMVDPATRSG